MIIVILFIITVLFVIGFVLRKKNLFWDKSCGYMGYGMCILALFMLFAFVSIVAFYLTHSVLNLSTIDSKIAMYTESNTKIESQIEVAVKQYQQYEKDIYTELAPESYITLVSMYPELKSDKLLQEQIKVYIDNNKKIISLKEEKINGKVIRWWLYFG